MSPSTPLQNVFRPARGRADEQSNSTQPERAFRPTPDSPPQPGRGTGGETVIECAGLFSFIGADPCSGWLSGCAALDDRGFVLTDFALTSDHLDPHWEVLARSPLPFETSHPGLFAVGDLHSGSIKRVAAAVGEGSSAVRSVHQYLAFSN